MRTVECVPTWNKLLALSSLIHCFTPPQIHEDDKVVRSKSRTRLNLSIWPEWVVCMVLVSLCKHFHASLDSIAKFKSLIFLMPSPPTNFRRQMLSHAFRCKVCWVSPIYAQKKLLICLSILSNKLFGRLKDFLVYPGIAWATDLIRTTRPAREQICLGFVVRYSCCLGFCPVEFFLLHNQSVYR